MDSIQAFQQAALLLQAEPCYQELKRCRDVNDTDSVLQEMVKEYGRIRMELDQCLEKGEAAVELDAKATKLYGEIMAYPGIVQYHQAKLKAETLIAYLGNIITTAMNGGDPRSVTPSNTSGCSGSCHSCSGCGG